MKNPLHLLQDARDKRRADSHGERVGHTDGGDVDQFLTSIGKVVPERLRIAPERAQSELILAEQQVTALRLQMTAAARDVRMTPSPWPAQLLSWLLAMLEVLSLTWIFVRDGGMMPIPGFGLGALITVATFTMTRTLYSELQKPRHERSPYTWLIAAVFVTGSLSIMAYRLSTSTNTGESLTTTIATSILVGIATFFPGWKAAQLHNTAEHSRTVRSHHASLSIEYRQEQLRVAGLRQNIDATTPDDLRLLDQREQLRAIHEGATARARGGTA